MRRAPHVLLGLLLSGFGVMANAEELIMARIKQSFPEAITRLQETIRDKGYTVTRVQRVDVGLASRGFTTAEYRIVFYGKADEQKSIAAAHPELIPYLPLNFVVFAENEDTLILCTNPLKLGDFFDKPQLQVQFKHWEQDVREIFAKLSDIGEAGAR